MEDSCDPARGGGALHTLLTALQRSGRRQENPSRSRRRLRFVVALFLGLLVPTALILGEASQRKISHVSDVVVAFTLLAVFAVTMLILSTVIEHHRHNVRLIAIGIAFMTQHLAFGFNLSPPHRYTSAVGGLLEIIIVCLLILTMGNRSRISRSLNAIAAVLALAGVALLIVSVSTNSDWTGPSAEIAIALMSVLGGALALDTGDREIDPVLTAIGMLGFLIGASNILMLSSGEHQITAAVAVVSVTGAGLMVAASGMAVIDALKRRDATAELHEYARSIELERLSSQADTFDEIMHDERSSLLAIEAAARQLSRRPSESLAAAVEAEAVRLQNRLNCVVEPSKMFDVSEAATAIVGLLMSQHPGISVEAPESCFAWGNTADFATVVRTLVDNAFDHGREPVAVTVHDSPEGAVVSVTDAGDGIASALRYAVFQRGITTKPDSHSGLGLFEGTRLARKNGGDLSISSSPNGFQYRLAAEAPIDLRFSDSNTQLQMDLSARG